MNTRNKIKTAGLIISQIFSALIFSVVLIPKLIDATYEADQSPVSSSTQLPATLTMLPSSGSFYEGDVIQVLALVHTGSQPINAVRAHISYPSDLMEIIQISSDASFCSFFVEQEFDNQTGQIIYSCGAPSPGFSGEFGLVGTFYFRMKKTGYANLQFAQDSTVLANDGFGTDLLSGTSGASFNIIERLDEYEQLSPVGEQDTAIEIPLPVLVNSKTHSDQNKWYKHGHVEFEFQKTNGTIGFSYLLDQESDSRPDPSKYSTDNFVKYDGLEDGIWYLHFMEISQDDVGPISHYKIQIDSDAPEPPEVTAIERNDDQSLWTLYLSANDDNDISKYEVIVDGETYEVQKKIEVKAHELESDDITIIAYDLSGNSSLTVYTLPGPEAENETTWEQIQSFIDSLIESMKRNL